MRVCRYAGVCACIHVCMWRSIIPMSSHCQLSLRKTSISTLADKEGKGLNKLEAMSVGQTVVDREGKEPNKGVITWKI